MISSAMYNQIDVFLRGRGALCSLAEVHAQDDPMLQGMVALAEIGVEAVCAPTDDVQALVAGRVADALMVLNYGKIVIR